MELIRESLACMRCGYDLLRQPIDGRCPECGLPVASSLALRLDHLQHGEAALRRPGRVAAAVVMAAVNILLSTVLQLAAPLLASLDSLRGQVSLLQGQVRLWGWMVSLASVLVSGFLLWSATRPSEVALHSELGRWRRWMLVGHVAWAVALAIAAGMEWFDYAFSDPLRNSIPWGGVAIQLPGMTCALSAFHALLAITGRRSQALREARAARQSVTLMNTTAALAVVFAIAVPLLHRLEQDWASTFAMAGAACMSVLLVFGAAYLLANAWWVAHALLLPKSKIEDMVDAL
jgi:hypothetical protein